MKKTFVIILILLGLYGFINVFPVYFMFITSLQPERYAFYPSLWQPNPSFYNYIGGLLQPLGGTWTAGTAGGSNTFIHLFENSLFIGLGVVAVAILTSVSSGYSLARLRYRGRSIIGNAVIVSYMIPSSFLIVPLFMLLHIYGLLDTYQGIILAETTFVLPYAIWIFREHFNSIPTEVLESAEIDGASMLRTIRSIVMPLSVGTIVALATFAFVISWNEYLLVLVLTIKQSTVPIGMTFLLGSDQVPWGILMAMSILYTIPPVAFYFAFSKYLTRGIMSGAVKG